MSYTQVYFAYNENIYKFVSSDRKTDGSVVIFLDRKHKTLSDIRSNFDTDLSQSRLKQPTGARSTARFTFHSTGQINFYLDGNFHHKIYIDPLYEIDRLHFVGIISIPKISSLNKLSEGEKVGKNDILITLKDFADERLTFGIIAGPATFPYPLTSGFENLNGFILSWEKFGIMFSQMALPKVECEVQDNSLVVGLAKAGAYRTKQIDTATAEILSFRKSDSPNFVPLFRQPDGSYILHADIVMARPPQLVMEFTNPNLSIEQVSFANGLNYPHKVRFWIRDKGGRNKKDDLRHTLIGFTLDASPW